MLIEKKIKDNSRYVDEKEIKAFKAKAGEVDIALIDFVLSTGVRVSEIELIIKQ
jgi:integrase